MRAARIIPPALLTAGCSGVQSVLAPAGDHAARIADLSWLLFAGGAAIFVIVMAALWAAIFGPPRLQRLVGDSRIVAIGGIAFPVAVLTALLAYGTWLMRTSIASGPPAQVRVEVEGQQWWWRVTYVRPDGTRIEGANEIRVPVGEPVDFVLTSPDVIHSFWVPALGGKVDMIPGRTTTLRLTAERPGVYRGQCAEYCGGPHALMAFEVRAIPPDEFRAWLEESERPAPSGDGRGAALVVAAGCGACHTIRGTEADGRVGPDLTRVGGRRYIAAATLPTNAENIADFIAHGPHIKPGNLMPPFHALPPDDLEAIAAYLAGLK